MQRGYKQAINQRDRALPEGNYPQRIRGRLPQPLRTRSPWGREAKDPPPVPKLPKGNKRGSPPPGSLPLLCLSPVPLGRFYSSRYQMSIIGSEKQQTL